VSSARQFAVPVGWGGGGIGVACRWLGRRLVAHGAARRRDWL